MDRGEGSSRHSTNRRSLMFSCLLSFCSFQIERRDERRQRIQSAREAAAAAAGGEGEGGGGGEAIEDDHTYGAVKRRVSSRQSSSPGVSFSAVEVIPRTVFSCWTQSWAS